MCVNGKASVCERESERKMQERENENERKRKMLPGAKFWKEGALEGGGVLTPRLLSARVVGLLGCWVVGSNAESSGRSHRRRGHGED